MTIALLNHFTDTMLNLNHSVNSYFTFIRVLLGLHFIVLNVLKKMNIYCVIWLGNEIFCLKRLFRDSLRQWAILVLGNLFSTVLLVFFSFIVMQHFVQNLFKHCFLHMIDLIKMFVIDSDCTYFRASNWCLCYFGFISAVQEEKK